MTEQLNCQDEMLKEKYFLKYLRKQNSSCSVGTFPGLVGKTENKYKPNIRRSSCLGHHTPRIIILDDFELNRPVFVRKKAQATCF